MGLTESLVKGCLGKVQHKTLLSVQWQIEHASKKTDYYLCKHCNHYHITTDREVSQPKPKKQKIKVPLRKFKPHRDKPND